MNNKIMRSIYIYRKFITTETWHYNISKQIRGKKCLLFICKSMWQKLCKCNKSHHYFKVGRKMQKQYAIYR